MVASPRRVVASSQKPSGSQPPAQSGPRVPHGGVSASVLPLTPSRPRSTPRGCMPRDRSGAGWGCGPPGLVPFRSLQSPGLGTVRLAVGADRGGRARSTRPFSGPFGSVVGRVCVSANRAARLAARMKEEPPHAGGVGPRSGNPVSSGCVFQSSRR